MIVGVGVDIVNVDRLRRTIQRTPGFLDRVFTPAEQAYAQAAPRHTYQRLAARFAAKEALLKALGTGLRNSKWIEAEVSHDDLGRPLLSMTGGLAALAGGRGVTAVHLSMAHDRGHAIAHVLAVGTSLAAGQAEVTTVTEPAAGAAANGGIAAPAAAPARIRRHAGRRRSE